MIQPTRIAVIGDIHLQYDFWDTEYFNQSDLDLLLFVGDMGDFFHPKMALQVAGEISKLQKPAILIPGNHDVHNTFQVIAEILRSRWLASLSSYYHFEYHQRLIARLSPIEVGGYSLHPFESENIQFDLIAARPFSMGGSSLSCRPLLRNLYGINDLAQSTALLCKLVDLAESDNLIFLAHNGPTGLGDEPVDIWGCDFDPKQGDFGDPDLEKAVQYAQEQGKHVLAVVGGHMHIQTYLGPKPIWKRYGLPGPERPICVEVDGVVYINAARVPRIFEREGKSVHHHILLQVEGQEVDVKEVIVDNELKKER